MIKTRNYTNRIFMGDNVFVFPIYLCMQTAEDFSYRDYRSGIVVKIIKIIVFSF